MKAHIKLGRIFGVAVGLHYSWIIIALLVTLSLRSPVCHRSSQLGRLYNLEYRDHNGTLVLRVHLVA